MSTRLHNLTLTREDLEIWSHLGARRSNRLVNFYRVLSTYLGQDRRDAYVMFRCLCRGCVELLVSDENNVPDFFIHRFPR